VRRYIEDSQNLQDNRRNWPNFRDKSLQNAEAINYKKRLYIVVEAQNVGNCTLAAAQNVWQNENVGILKTG